MNTYLPSLLVANVFDPVSKKEDTIMNLYQRIADLNFYKSLETRIIFDHDIRASFANLSIQQNWDITYWLTSNLNEKKYSLGNTVSSLRNQAIDYTKELIDLGIEGNAHYIGICSGKHVAAFDEEYQAFLETTKTLLRHISNTRVKLLLEPLDMRADKKFIIGDLNLVSKFYCDLKNDGYATDKVILCIDTAHIALNQDSIYTYMDQLSQYSNRIHFANAHLSLNDTLYGDKHLPFGQGGFLNELEVINLFNHTNKLQFLEETIYLTYEIRSKTIEEMWDTEAYGRRLIGNLLRKAS